MTHEDEWFLVKDFFQSDVRGVLGDGTVYFLGGGFKYFLFSPLFGEDFQFVEPNWESIRGRIFKQIQFYHIRLAIIA